MGPGRGGLIAIDQGSIVLVPFPFTDLTSSKQRPALVVSPVGIHREDLILCVAKLFTCHRMLIRGRFGTLEMAKLAIVLDRLRVLFGEPLARDPDASARG